MPDGSSPTPQSPTAIPRGTPPGLLVRAATEADLGAVVGLLVLGAVQGRPRREDPADLSPYAAALRAIDGGGGQVLVAVLGEEVVGVCQLIVFQHLQARGGRCAELESVHVHPDHRGAGVGGTLVRHAIERARRLGCYRVQLTSDRERPRAHRFYEQLGFTASHVGFKLPLAPVVPVAPVPPLGGGPAPVDPQA